MIFNQSGGGKKKTKYDTIISLSSPSIYNFVYFGKELYGVGSENYLCKINRDANDIGNAVTFTQTGATLDSPYYVGKGNDVYYPSTYSLYGTNAGTNLSLYKITSDFTKTRLVNLDVVTGNPSSYPANITICNGDIYISGTFAPSEERLFKYNPDSKTLTLVLSQSIYLHYQLRMYDWVVGKENSNIMYWQLYKEAGDSSADNEAAAGFSEFVTITDSGATKTDTGIGIKSYYNINDTSGDFFDKNYLTLSGTFLHSNDVTKSYGYYGCNAHNYDGKYKVYFVNRSSDRSAYNYDVFVRYK